MKILCYSDLHRNREAASNLLAASADVDITIGAGDFATCREGLADTLDILSRITKPSILVPGNSESFEELSEAASGWSSAFVLHGSGCTINELQFWGVGGGIPITPFGSWSYDFDEQQAKELLADCPHNGILVLHSPPFDTVDRCNNGEFRGSRSIRHAVEEKTPKMVFCGHIHSNWQTEITLGFTRVINAGPQGIIVQL